MSARPAYIAVIGASDHIKYGPRREKLPIWHFLDRIPDGWLTSLANPRTDLPRTAIRIGDCGAWTYRREDVPTLRGEPVTPMWAAQVYSAVLPPGSIAIAPDHMLIPGMGDTDARRAFNAESAAAFLPLARDAGLTPAAAVHGLTHAERAVTARRLRDIGYTTLAIGGLAGQAGRWHECVCAVEVVRDAAPDVHLHVLGLAAPSYAAEWARIGVNTYDGAAAYLDAFRNGRFYIAEGGTLVKYPAVQAGEEPAAPLCDCRTCSMLATEGVDTRLYGTNQSNMGRAAHNLNHLMRAIAACTSQLCTPAHHTRPGPRRRTP